MDSYDEIFDFLEVTPDKRMACLKHLLNSTRAKLNDATKGKIYGRVSDFDSTRTVTVHTVHTIPQIVPSSGSSDSGSDKSTKSKRSAKQMMKDKGLTNEMLVQFNIYPSGKDGKTYLVKDVEQAEEALKSKSVA
jgi:hypothetical protein